MSRMKNHHATEEVQDALSHGLHSVKFEVFEALLAFWDMRIGLSSFIDPDISEKGSRKPGLRCYACSRWHQW
jgi:hypothetical protein